MEVEVEVGVEVEVEAEVEAGVEVEVRPAFSSDQDMNRKVRADGIAVGDYELGRERRRSLSYSFPGTIRSHRHVVSHRSTSLEGGGGRLY